MRYITRLMVSCVLPITVSYCGDSDQQSNSHHLVVDEKLYQHFMEQKDVSAPKDTQYLGNLDAQSSESEYLVSMNDKQYLSLTEHIHDLFNRCGGYFHFDEMENALDSIDLSKLSINESSFKSFAGASTATSPYTLDQQKLVTPALGHLSRGGLLNVMEHLASYNNRYYTADTGSDSQKWIADQWRQLTQNRSDSRVELITHKGWPQPSVVLTITGSEHPEQSVVIGGHGDSIQMRLLPIGVKGAAAPGSDDNASGIAVMTETIAALVKANYQPKRTIKFISYAAEEVGLRGSKEIAENARKNQEQVIGVLQLDMTNYPGSEKIGLMTDFTDPALTDFVGQLIKTYTTASYQLDRCGYACSDHASWTKYKYPSAMPHETPMNKNNKKIHSTGDTLKNSDPTAQKSETFARLATAFAIELAK